MCTLVEGRICEKKKCAHLSKCFANGQELSRAHCVHTVHYSARGNSLMNQDIDINEIIAKINVMFPNKKVNVATREPRQYKDNGIK